MSTFNCGVVITVGPGREENLLLTLEHLLPTPRLQAVMIVSDGPEVRVLDSVPHDPGLPMHNLSLPEKHHPGLEQPRNVGVRHLHHLHPELTHVWFLDSDILVAREALAYYEAASARCEEAVLVGPYDWMAPGTRHTEVELKNDGRWAMFNERSGDIHVGDLGVALGNFGGNLIWPILEFIRVGGFHPDLHHGRCEDGELGLRAASLRVPMILVPEARGWHLWHEVNGDLVRQRNARDVPLLNSFHPWVQLKCAQCKTVREGGHDHCLTCGSSETAGGLLLTTEDGARFDFVCPQCGAQINTLEMWEHQSTHNQSALILPDGLADMQTQSWEQTLVDRQHEAIQDHIRALIEQENIAIPDLAEYTGMDPQFIQRELEKAQRRSHE